MSEEKKSEETKKESTCCEVDNGKLAAILSYLLIGIIWFFADDKLKKNEFAKFHVKQASVLLIVSVCGSIILGFISVLGWMLLPFFSIASFAFAVIGIINAAQNEKKELPFIGPYAKKLNF